MYNAELLAIVEPFKNWYNYLKDGKYKILVLTNHNNLCQFMDTKSLSSHRVRCTQKLSCYQFRINYCQGKANGAAKTLSCYFQQSLGKEKILQAKNTKILQRLLSLLANAYISSTSSTHIASLLHVIIYEMHTFPDLYQFWEMFHQELAVESSYQASIRGMRLRLVELQVEDSQMRKIRAEKLGRNQQNSDRILHYQGLHYVSEIIRIELISKHHYNLLVGHFGIKKMRELITKKYYNETLRYDVEVYIRHYDVCLVSQAVRYKPYRNLQQLTVSIYQQKDLFLDFIIGLPQSVD